VTRIVIDIVLLEKRDELLLETALLMMFGLRMDVFNRRVHMGNAYRERTLSFLPMKHRAGMLVDPLGRAALQQLHGLRDRHGPRKRQQHMHMIIGAADGQCFHVVLACDTAEVSPQLWAQVLGDTLATDFG